MAVYYRDEIEEKGDANNTNKKIKHSQCYGMNHNITLQLFVADCWSVNQ